MNVLVDTSVWVDQFRRANAALGHLLAQDRAWVHPMVCTELACGTPPAPRAKTLGDIALLGSVQQATLDEVRAFTERERLYGLGCGLVDLVLLCSVLITPNTKLWTTDKSLHELARRFDVAYAPAH